MGFKFEKRKRQAVLLERQDIILWCRNYLRKIRNLRQENVPIYYLDETWVNEGHSETRVWQDTTIKNSYEASSSNLTVAFHADKNKKDNASLSPSKSNATPKPKRKRSNSSINKDTETLNLFNSIESSIPDLQIDDLERNSILDAVL
ncbi:uncharacterized protein TNCT_253151 [Trichonephila clavata]|uniref:Uncharacterized protein n=1 Tax=Trichonephila clavata TaxID=2740835 RepID=A0A8X6JEM5_TRICU|nr:uncharacterized protein TNCT_253151 [Trichonephila clavata]